jgi:hypothetical protein
MRESVPVTCGTLAAWGVASETCGANWAGAAVGLVEKFGVGTTTIALPPGAWKVGLAAGWAAPPPTTGARCGKAVAVVWAAGDGAGEPAGLAAGPSFEGGVAGADVQPSTEASISTAATTTRLSGPKDTRKLLPPRDDTDPDANQPPREHV